MRRWARGLGGAACAALIVAAWGCAVRQMQFPEDEKIEHLLSYVAGLKGASFVIDGKDVTPAEASAYFRAAWQARKTEISTAKDFIRLAASFSAKTGNTHLVTLADGSQVMASEELDRELRRHEFELRNR